MKADEERSDADDQGKIDAARQDRWKSRICRNMQLRGRQGEEESRYYGNNFMKREERRKRRRRRMLDLVGLEEVSTTEFEKADDGLLFAHW